MNTEEYSIDKKHLVFVYGTLKRYYSNHYLMRKTSQFVEAGYTSSDFNMVNVGFPYTFRNGKYRVKGELWLVDGPAFLRLDHLEGHPDHFRRVKERIYCVNTGSMVESWMYQNPNHEEFFKLKKYTVNPNESGDLIWTPNR